MWWRLQLWWSALAEWAYCHREIRAARRVLNDPASLQILTCGHCHDCLELQEFRLNEGRRYW